MKRLSIWLVSTLVLAATAAPMGILVPAYFEPPTYWDELNFAASRVPLVVIANPYNGPGPSLDPVYLANIQSLRAAGARVIGYVYTSYAARDTNAVRSDIATFFQWYPLDGIFIDEMTNDANPRHYAYYAGLSLFIHGKGTNLFVMGNPGTTTQEPYLTSVDSLMTFENFSGYSKYIPDAWVNRHLARDFCHIIYAVTNEATMTNYIDLAASRNAGWVFISDNPSTTNPYDRLPAYWTNEVNYISALNSSQPAPRLQAQPPSNGSPVLLLSGLPGVYELQVSTNLVDWRATAMARIVTNSTTVKDSSATYPPSSFYRARQ